MIRPVLVCFILTAFAVPPAVSAPEIGEPPVTPARASPVPEPGGSPSLAISCTATLASRYLFLGVDQNEGHPVFQPEIDLAAGAWSVSVWANHDLDRGLSDELDFEAGFARSFGALSVSESFAYLSYPHRYGCGPSQELILGLAYEAAFTPELEVHYDFEEGDGVYAAFSAMRAAQTPVGSLSAGGRLYYQSGFYGETGIPAAEIVAGGEWPAGPVVLSPSISRLVSWENGSFTGESRAPSLWLFRLDVTRDF